MPLWHDQPSAAASALSCTPKRATSSYVTQTITLRRSWCPHVPRTMASRRRCADILRSSRSTQPPYAARECLEEWQRIPRGRALNGSERAYVRDVLAAWLVCPRRSSSHAARLPDEKRPVILRSPAFELFVSKSLGQVEQVCLPCQPLYRPDKNLPNRCSRPPFIGGAVSCLVFSLCCGRFPLQVFAPKGCETELRWAVASAAVGLPATARAMASFVAR